MKDSYHTTKSDNYCNKLIICYNFESRLYHTENPPTYGIVSDNKDPDCHLWQTKNYRIEFID
nr:hypothetical protein [Treponema sp.]